MEITSRWRSPWNLCRCPSQSIYLQRLDSRHRACIFIALYEPESCENSSKGSWTSNVQQHELVRCIHYLHTHLHIQEEEEIIPRGSITISNCHWFMRSISLWIQHTLAKAETSYSATMHTSKACSGQMRTVVFTLHLTENQYQYYRQTEMRTYMRRIKTALNNQQ